MKNASATSKSQMLPSLLPLPASFFKVLPLPQKFNRFHIPDINFNMLFNIAGITHVMSDRFSALVI